MPKPISISLVPNNEKDDVKLALKLIFQPWKWKKGRMINKLEQDFKNYLDIKYAFSFNSGRSAFMAILKALEMPKDSEVLLQALTCNAASNPIIWSGFKPIYIDVQTESFNMDLHDLALKIGHKAKAVMIQHTFGLPADINEIKAIADEKGLFLIEDCAHALGAEYNGQKIGTFGKAAFFSFGRDKIISSVWGGMAVTNDSELATRLEKIQREYKLPSNLWILKQLLHPVLMNYIVMPLYNVLDLGKIFLVLTQIFGILTKAVNKKEKKAKRPNYFPERLPNALAILADNQFKKLEKFNKRRQELAKFYDKELANTFYNLPKKYPDRKNVYLRYSVIHPKAHEIIWEAWHKENILIGDWYTTPIAPYDTDLIAEGYEKGSCKNVEWLAKRMFNLPTNITITDERAQRIVKFLKNFR